MAQKQVIAMGGGGFSMEPDNPAMDLYVLKQSQKDRPKICFLAHASGDSQDYILRFYHAFSKFNCQPSHMALFRSPPKDIKSFIMDKDIIYVGGGYTHMMFALWKESGLDIILKEAYESGIIMSGMSTGGECWFETFPLEMPDGSFVNYPGLGLIPGSMTVHYDENEMHDGLHTLLSKDAIQAGYAAENSAALHFVDGKLHQAVRSIPEAQAFHVPRQHGEIVESPLAMVDA